MTLIADIAHDIIANPAPVLFLDTCILLDIVRAPLRNKADEVRFAQVFLASAQKNPKTIHFLVGSPVQTEWNKNIQSVKNDCNTGVYACNAVSSICGQLGLPAVALLQADVFKMPDLLQQLSTDLLAACVSIDYDIAALSRAADRIITNAHPAKPENDRGAKDSMILEHAVETTIQLRNAKFSGTCMLVSSNTKDYAATGSTNIHPKLQPAFGPASLQYAVSLTHAESVLTTAGWVA